LHISSENSPALFMNGWCTIWTGSKPKEFWRRESVEWWWGGGGLQGPPGERRRLHHDPWFVFYGELDNGLLSNSICWNLRAP